MIAQLHPSSRYHRKMCNAVSTFCVVAAILSLWSVSYAEATEAPAPAKRVEPRSIIVHLATNTPSYSVGNVISFAVRVEESCHLTLISIDGDGFATVLYPNDFQQDNYLPAGPTVAIPAKDAPYQLRLNKSGIETVLAICNQTAKRPLGIGHDFDRERFTILGDWTAFTAAIEKREKELKAHVARENRRRRRKRGKPPAIDLGPPPAADEAEGRSLILLPVSRAAQASRADQR